MPRQIVRPLPTGEYDIAVALYLIRPMANNVLVQLSDSQYS
jgi:hypothetical protein